MSVWWSMNHFFSITKAHDANRGSEYELWGQYLEIFKNCWERRWIDLLYPLELLPFDKKIINTDKVKLITQHMLIFKFLSIRQNFSTPFNLLFFLRYLVKTLFECICRTSTNLISHWFWSLSCRVHISIATSTKFCCFFFPHFSTKSPLFLCFMDMRRHF